jgi:plastocyanin
MARWATCAVLTLAAAGVTAAERAPTGSPGRAGLVPTTHEVRLVGSTDGGYRFEPAEITARSGDSVAFLAVSGGPHNVAFDSAGLTPLATRRLDERLQRKIAPLSGPLLANGDRYAISLEGVPAGRYPFVCMPHIALQMKGVMVVK